MRSRGRAGEGERTRKETAAALLERHGRTYGSELGIDLGRNTPSVLFPRLCASILSSARIGARQALKAAKASSAQGWTTARKRVASRREDRVAVLNRVNRRREDAPRSPARPRRLS